MRSNDTSRVGPRAWIAEHDPLPVVGRPAAGYAVDGAYAETYWLGIIGPSALWALRRLVAMIDRPSGCWVPLSPFAQELGLGTQTGRNSTVVACLDRLLVFGFAEILDGAYTVRVAVPDLSYRQRLRLAPHLLATIDAHSEPKGQADVQDHPLTRRH